MGEDGQGGDAEEIPVIEQKKDLHDRCTMFCAPVFFSLRNPVDFSILELFLYIFVVNRTNRNLSG